MPSMSGSACIAVSVVEESKVEGQKFQIRIRIWIRNFSTFDLRLFDCLTFRYARQMRLLASLLAIGITAGTALAQVPGGMPPTARPGHKMRVKIDSAPQQAAVYVDSKDYGIQGYTPATLKLPKGTYTIILEMPGFRPVQK